MIMATRYNGDGPSLMQSLIRRASFMLVVAVLGVYAVVTLRGPHGIPALLAKREQIRAMQEENDALRKANMRRRERIRLLQESPSEQELVIKERLKLTHPGDTEFIAPANPDVR